MEMSAEDYADSLAHYGILRKSGRYPWGSGANPNQRSKSFLDILEGHRKDGLSEAEIAKLYDDRKNGFPFTVADLRAVKSRSVTLQKQDEIRQVQRLADKGMGNSAIARQMSTPEKKYNESTIRSLREEGRLEKLDVLQSTADMLKRQVEEKGMIDVGSQVQRDLPIFSDVPNVGISKDKFETALSMLKEEGYGVVTFKAAQVGTGENTTYRALVKLKPRQTLEQAQKEAFLNRDKIQLISEKTKDGGRGWQDATFQRPLGIDPKRVAVRYKEDGGADADGVIYVRPGVRDVSLGKNHYAQIRINVGDTHFLKGMAIYKNDLPPGVDLMFNTNKSSTGNKLDALKELKKLPLKDKDGNIVRKDGKAVDSDEVDWNNPFGSFPKLVGGQILGKDGKPESVMNILNEEGDWDSWSRNLSRQVLSKQSPNLAQTQLDLTYANRRKEFEEISSLTNPLIKRKLLETFSDETDSASVHLKAASLPRQATKVILPVSSMKPTEVFAPTFRDGERVSLVRFPHAGTFEIPELTVNNKNREARELFGIKQGRSTPDAIGIHPKVAERLSGADFDGDAVVVLPHTKAGKLESRPPLERLKNFDPQQYKVPTPKEDPVNGRITIKDATKQTEMGKVTNLIADMTIRGAKDDEIANAVRHSMVVIDSEKHNLDHKASERDHGILALKKTYQESVNEKGNRSTGASTLITRATSRKDVPKRKAAQADHPGSGAGVTRLNKNTVDNKTGKKVFEFTEETDKRGRTKTFRSKKLSETDDAFTLVSEHGGQPIERVYATHSNRLKKLADEARLEAIRTQPLKRSASAAKTYSKEVESLNAQLNDALKNAPLERRAQAVAREVVAQRRRANSDMDAAEKKKIRGKALEDARVRIGAKKHQITISDREWEAIQNGALSIDKLKHILNNTDVDKLRERATPRSKPVMNDMVTRRAKAMLSGGATLAEVAEALGIPVSTLQSGLE